MSYNDTDERFSLLELDFPSKPIGYSAPPPVATTKPTLTADAGQRVCGLLGTMAKLSRPARPVLVPWSDQLAPFDALDPLRALGEAIQAMGRIRTRRARLNPTALLAGGRAVYVACMAHARWTRKLAQLPFYMARSVAPALAVAAPAVTLESLAADVTNGADEIREISGQQVTGRYGYQLFTWRGHGQLPWVALADVAERCGVPLPTTKDQSAYLGEAVQAEQCTEVVVRKVRGKAEHTVSRRRSDAQVGDPLADVTVRCWLNAEGAVVASPGSCQRTLDRIVERYTYRRDSQLLKPADVTSWLTSVFHSTFGGVKTAYGWHVQSAEHCATAEQLCRLIKDLGWGRDWGIGAYGRDGRGILDSLADGLAEQVQTELANLATQRKAAKDQGRADVGPRMATAMIARLEETAERTRAYAQIIGADRVRAVFNQAQKLLAELRPLVSDAAQRASLIWDEIEQFGDTPTAG